MTREDAIALLERLAAGWNAGDAEAAAACFAEDVDYADPMRYGFSRREGPPPFFEPPPTGHQVTWHRILWDDAAHTATVEYTYAGHHRYHGAALVEMATTALSTAGASGSTSTTPGTGTPSSPRRSRIRPKRPPPRPRGSPGRTIRTPSSIRDGVTVPYPKISAPGSSVCPPPNARNPRIPTPASPTRFVTASSSTPSGSHASTCRPAEAPTGRSSGRLARQGRQQHVAPVPGQGPHPPQVEVELSALEEVGEGQLLDGGPPAVGDLLRARDPRRRSGPGR